MDEIWKPILGTNESYSISNAGKIRRDKRTRGTRKNKILSPAKNRKGYLQICLYLPTKKVIMTIHSIVASHFIGPRPKGFTINHKDSDKLNNHVSNLEYLSPRENTLHSIKAGTHFIPKGSQHGQAKLKESQIKEIKVLYEQGFLSYKDIAKIYNVKSINTIARIIQNKGWCHV